MGGWGGFRACTPVCMLGHRAPSCCEALSGDKAEPAGPARLSCWEPSQGCQREPSVLHQGWHLDSYHGMAGVWHGGSMAWREYLCSTSRALALWRALLPAGMHLLRSLGRW